MLYMMTIKIDRKNLNEKDNLNLEITNDNSTLLVNATDESVSELLYEIFKVDNDKKIL